MRQQRQHGFMIVQMLIVLGVLGAFSVVAVRVFRLSMLTTERAAREQETLIRQEQAMRTLREDIGSATQVEVQQGRLRAGQVEWRSEPGGDLVRVAGDDQRRWTELGETFERQGAWVVVRRGGREVALLRQRTGGAR
jgi:type II secretory pathway pseudopilin PulG